MQGLSSSVAWHFGPRQGSRSTYYERSITVFHNSKFFEHQIRRFEQQSTYICCAAGTAPQHSQWMSLSSLSVVPAAPSGEISIQTTQQRGSYPDR